MHFQTDWLFYLVALVTLSSQFITSVDGDITVNTDENTIPHVPSRIERRELLLKRCHSHAELKGVNLTLQCTGSDVLAIHLAYFSTVFPEDCSSPEESFHRSHQQHEASFKDDLHSMSNSLDSQFGYSSGCTEDIRLTLNSLCSGLNNCTFDFPFIAAYFEKCDSFSNGWINVQYTCVNEKHRSAFCQQHYSAPFGYLSTPGYPQYYSPFACRWSIQALPGQRIQLQIVDLAIREPDPIPAAPNRRRRPGEPSEKCLDTLDIIDGDVKTKTFCGERNSNLIEYRSLGESLQIEFHPKNFSPSRGVFMKYSLVNCPTLNAPANGNRQRNGSFAYYSCNFDQVFEDTGNQELTLYCVDDHYWNGTVPRCIAPNEHEDLLDTQRAKLASSIFTNLTSGLGITISNEIDELKNNESYAQFNRSIWIIVILIILAIFILAIIYQCVSTNLQYCFNRAGNYKIEEQEPVNV